MFQSLDRLRGLISRPAHTYRPTVETFSDLDTQRLSKEMELAKRGESRGAEDQPTSDSSSLDAVETEIIEHIGAAQKRAHDQLENHLAGFRQRLIDLDFDTQFSNIKSAALGGLSDLKQELQTGVDDLHGLRRDLTAAEKWHASFQKTHRLERPAKIGTPRASFFKWALIVILVLVELILNGELLSKGSELGLVGGIVEAFIFAVLNVGVALMFGIFWIPFVNHRNWLVKLFGLVGLGAYLACMVGINLALAHYREVAGVLFEGAGEVVMQRLIQDPLGIQDFRSWLLFGLGVLFSIIAVVLLCYLAANFPGTRYQGIDVEAGLVGAAPAHDRISLLAGDYLQMEAKPEFDLVICNFGFDSDRFPASKTPHSIGQVGESKYCLGCSDDLASHLQQYFRAWRGWAEEDAALLMVGRIPNFGFLRAVVIAAAAKGWQLELDESTVLKVTAPDVGLQRYPALQFRASAAALISIEDVERFFAATE